MAWTHGGFAIDGDYIWFVPYMLNVLCRYNISSNCMEEVIVIPEINLSSAGFLNVVKINNFVILIPAFEKKVCVYHIEDNKIEMLEIPGEKCNYEKFQHVAVWRNKLFLFPIGYSCIIKIYLDTFKIDRLHMDEEICNMFVSAVVKGQNVYLINKSDKLYVFDMSKELLSVHCSFDRQVEIRTIDNMHDNMLVLSDTKGSVYSYDLDKDYLKKIWEGEGIQYKSCVCVREHILLVPLLEKEYLEVGNFITKEKMQIKLNNRLFYQKWPHAVFSTPILNKSKVYLFSTQYRTLLQYDFKKNTLVEMVLRYGEMQLEEMRKLVKNSMNFGALEEGIIPCVTLDLFLKVLMEDNMCAVSNK